MPIQAVEVQRLYRQIADHLSELIASGEFPEGTRLPSERELAEQLGVSRPSVREALIALEVAGKVEVRVGSGIFVAPRRPVALVDPSKEGQGPFELLRARALVEGEVAAEAARTADPEELDVIRAAVEEMRVRQRRNLNPEEADRDFHLAIARATHNSPLASVVQDLWDRGRGDIWRRMEQHFQTPELRAAILEDHQTILAALETRDSRAARSLMRRHLERVDREFSRGWELLKEQEGVESPKETVSPTRRRAARSR
jgi:DNA-binding FadR family transcriptional regulator